MSIHTPLTHEVTGTFVLITVIGVVVEAKDLANPSVKTLINCPIRTYEEFVVIDCSAT